MNNITGYCAAQPAKPQYVQLTTASNDPNISRAMRYSQYVRHNRYKTVVFSAPLPAPPPPTYSFTQVIPRANDQTQGYQAAIPPSYNTTPNNTSSSQYANLLLSPPRI